MPMKNPAHPGRIVRDDCLEPLGLSVPEGAKVLGITRQALNNLVNGNPASALKWPCASRKLSAAPPKRGCGCSCL